MLAQVKKDCRYPIITAFGGLEYVQYEYRAVPVGQENSAKDNPYLDLVDNPYIMDKAVSSAETVAKSQPLEGIAEDQLPQEEETIVEVPVDAKKKRGK